MERLFMQIFDRKNWIRDQLAQQIDSYSESLAFNLLADSRKPPPWLLENGDQNELDREQIISGAFFQPPWMTTPSTNLNNIYTLPPIKGILLSRANDFDSEMLIAEEPVSSGKIDAQSHNECRVGQQISGGGNFGAPQDSARFPSPARMGYEGLKQYDTSQHVAVAENYVYSGDDVTIKTYARKKIMSTEPSLASEQKNTLVSQTTDGGRDDFTRPACQSLDYNINTCESLGPSSCVSMNLAENREYEGLKQLDTGQHVAVAENYACNGNVDTIKKYARKKIMSTGASLASEQKNPLASLVKDGGHDDSTRPAHQSLNCNINTCEQPGPSSCSIVNAPSETRNGKSSLPAPDCELTEQYTTPPVPSSCNKINAPSGTRNGKSSLPTLSTPDYELSKKHPTPPGPSSCTNINAPSETRNGNSSLPTLSTPAHELSKKHPTPPGQSSCTNINAPSETRNEKSSLPAFSVPDYELSEKHPTATIANELVLTGPDDLPHFKAVHSVDINSLGTHSVDVSKKLNFDTIEAKLDVVSRDAYLVVSTSKMESLQPRDEYLFCSPLMQASSTDFLPESNALHTDSSKGSMEVSVASHGRDKESSNLGYAGNSHFHSPLSTSCDELSTNPACLSIEENSSDFSTAPNIASVTSNSSERGSLLLPLMNKSNEDVSIKLSEGTPESFSFQPNNNLLDKNHETVVDEISNASIVCDIGVSSFKVSSSADMNVKQILKETSCSYFETQPVFPQHGEQESILPPLEVSIQQDGTNNIGQFHEDKAYLSETNELESKSQSVLYTDFPSLLPFDVPSARRSGNDAHRHVENYEEKVIQEASYSNQHNIRIANGDNSVNLVYEAKKLCFATEESEFLDVEARQSKDLSSASLTGLIENDSVEPERTSVASEATHGISEPGDKVSIAKESTIQVIPDVGQQNLHNTSNVDDEQIKIGDCLGSFSKFHKFPDYCDADGTVTPAPSAIFLHTGSDIAEISNDGSLKSELWNYGVLNNIESQKDPSQVPCFSRSLCVHRDPVESDYLLCSIKASSSKRSVGTVSNSHELSASKRRKVVHLSEDMLAISPGMMLSPIQNTQKGSVCSNQARSRSASVTKNLVQSSLSAAINDTEMGESSSASALEDPPQMKQLDVSSSKDRFQMVGSSVQMEQLDHVTVPEADGNSYTSPNNIMAGDPTLHYSSLHIFSKDCPEASLSCKNMNPGASKSPCSDMKFAEQTILHQKTDLFASDVSRMSTCEENSPESDQTMPEFEGFSIGIPFTIGDETVTNSEYPICADELGQHGNATSRFTPNFSAKYKINALPDVFHSLPPRIIEHANLNDYPGSTCVKNLQAGENSTITAISHIMESPFDSSFKRRLLFQSTPSVRTGGHPLCHYGTPKRTVSLVKVPATCRSSSELLGSNPEFVCFRIDENNSIDVENDQHNEFDISEVTSISRGVKMSTNNEALKEASSVYENEQNLAPLTIKFLERGILESLDEISYSDPQMQTSSSQENDCIISFPYEEEKENVPSTNKIDRKAAQSLCSNSSRSKMIGKTGERARSQGVLSKECKPSNIVSNISSFVPLVQKKQQAMSMKVKKDIKVKALEAAEAAKRLEEKKQNERVMRKAAAKLERTRLEQEKIIKQKQVEVKKQKEADIAAKKRKRDEEDRKGKEIKRRCNEQSVKIQKKQEQLHGKKEFNASNEKEVQTKAIELNQEKTLVGVEVASCSSIAEVDAIDEVVMATRLDGLEKLVQDRMSTTKEDQDFLSYEMSPYMNSSDEDEEEQSLRRRKMVPSWARKDILIEILLSKQHLDPEQIFSRKRSFELNEVLFPRLAPRPL